MTSSITLVKSTIGTQNRTEVFADLIGNITIDDVNTVIERIWNRVEIEPATGCWVYQTNDPHPYGRIHINGRKAYVHRVMYGLLTLDEPKGPGMMLDHICHNKKCCNPRHLRQVTAQQNCQNRVGANKSNTSSGLRNVYRNGSGYQVRVTLWGKRINGGTYKTPEKAAWVAGRMRAALYTHSAK